MGPRILVPRFTYISSKPIRNPRPLCARIASSRFISSDDRPIPKNDKPGPGPNQEQLPHVSEEAAEISKITGEAPPELEQDKVLKRDPNAKKNAPEVLKDKNKPPLSGSSRSYSTSARKQMDIQHVSLGDNPYDPGFNLSNLRKSLESVEVMATSSQEGGVGHKFGLPTLPVGKHDNLKYRYDPLLLQVTKLLMEDGKLARAQNNVIRILNYLRTSPPPRINPRKPLLPGSPPPSHLPLNPILYLTLAIDSVAPLLRMRSLRGMAGGGRSLPIPEPLVVRQRRRTAVMWILSAIEKKRSKGSGPGMFAQKFAEEIIAIVEGRSSVWDKRTEVHKSATASRANLPKLQAMVKMNKGRKR